MSNCNANFNCFSEWKDLVNVSTPIETSFDNQSYATVQKSFYHAEAYASEEHERALSLFRDSDAEALNPHPESSTIISWVIATLTALIGVAGSFHSARSELIVKHLVRGKRTHLPIAEGQVLLGSLISSIPLVIGTIAERIHLWKGLEIWATVGGEGYTSSNETSSDLRKRAVTGGVMHVLRLVKRTVRKTSDLRIQYTIALMVALILTITAVFETLITTARQSDIQGEDQTFQEFDPENGQLTRAKRAENIWDWISSYLQTVRFA